MTITRRPPRPAPTKASHAANRGKKTAETFIEDAHHPVAPAEPAEVAEVAESQATTEPAPESLAAAEAEKPAKKSKSKNKGKDKDKSKHKAEKTEKVEKTKRKDKEAVLIRFEDDQLVEMDQRAADLGLSRAAWLRMVVSKALRGKKV